MERKACQFTFLVTRGVFWKRKKKKNRFAFCKYAKGCGVRPYVWFWEAVTPSDPLSKLTWNSGSASENCMKNLGGWSRSECLLWWEIPRSRSWEGDDHLASLIIMTKSTSWPPHLSHQQRWFKKSCLNCKKLHHLIIKFTRCEKASSVMHYLEDLKVGGRVIWLVWYLIFPWSTFNSIHCHSFLSCILVDLAYWRVNARLRKSRIFFSLVPGEGVFSLRLCKI